MPHLYTLPLGAKSILDVLRLVASRGRSARTGTYEPANQRDEVHVAVAESRRAIVAPRFPADGTARCLPDQQLSSCPG